jgi:hypothetical protein
MSKSPTKSTLSSPKVDNNNNPQEPPLYQNGFTMIQPNAKKRSTLLDNAKKQEQAWQDHLEKNRIVSLNEAHKLGGTKQINCLKPI